MMHTFLILLCFSPHTVNNISLLVYIIVNIHIVYNSLLKSTAAQCVKWV